ncbi:unnamed protein product [Alopecurus aequalis]
MLRLRSCIAARLLSSTPAAPISPIHCLPTAAVSPNPIFAVEDYLVDNCGLTRAQALKASTKLSHLGSSCNPDAVLAVLASLGLSSADVASLVPKDPQLLLTSVEGTLSPNVAGLTALGLSPSEVARLVSLHPSSLRRRSIVSKMRYYLTIFGSFDTFLRALNRGPYLLSCNLDNAVKPNVAFLQECGLDACDIAKLCISQPWLLSTNQERVQATVACAEAVGVPRGSGMFRQALQGVAFLSEEKIAAKVEYLKKTFGWSDAEVGIAVCKFPMTLKLSNDTLQRKSEFLISEVGLEPAYIAHKPSMLSLRLDGRLRPRYYVVKFLKENGLLDRGRSYYASLIPTEKVFVGKYIHPYKETTPHLAEDYAAACRGEVRTRFRFT